MPRWKKTTTSPPSKLTVGWDKVVEDPNRSDGNYQGSIGDFVTPVEFGAEEEIVFDSVVNTNSATTLEPENRPKLPERGRTIVEDLSKTGNDAATTVAPTKSAHVDPDWHTQIKAKDSDILSSPLVTTKPIKETTTTFDRTSSPVKTTTVSTTTIITTKFKVPNPTTTVSTVATTKGSPTTTVAATTTSSPVIARSTTDMNDIVGDSEVDNNSEIPLGDGLVPDIPDFFQSPGAPAEVARPSIHEYGQPEDGE